MIIQEDTPKLIKIGECLATLTFSTEYLNVPKEELVITCYMRPSGSNNLFVGAAIMPEVYTHDNREASQQAALGKAIQAYTQENLQDCEARARRWFRQQEQQTVKVYTQTVSESLVA